MYNAYDAYGTVCAGRDYWEWHGGGQTQRGGSVHVHRVKQESDADTRKYICMTVAAKWNTYMYTL